MDLCSSNPGCPRVNRTSLTYHSLLPSGRPLGLYSIFVIHFTSTYVIPPHTLLSFLLSLFKRDLNRDLFIFIQPLTSVYHFCCSSLFCIHLDFLLVSIFPSAWRAYFKISYSVGLPMMNCYIFYMSEKEWFLTLFWLILLLDIKIFLLEV